ncbi:MAG: T9SS type B sorting domain-containing protein, partial [Bacteroidia bacterium]
GGTFNPLVSGPGTFVITYSISGMCGDTSTLSLTVHPAPSPTFSSDMANICTGQCVTFHETGSGSCASVIYHFGDGDSSLASTPTHCYLTAGVYSVSMQCTDANGCVGSINNANMITAVDIPVANFTMSPSTDIQPGGDVTFTNTTSASGVGFLWDFGDIGSGPANNSILTSPSHTFNNEGDFCISLVASNTVGCTDTAKYCIVVIGEGTIFIPNVFTPNGDGNNDEFLVSSHNMKEISYEIYDRWGLKIAEYNGLTGGWNGQTKNGRMAPDGTYYYILNATAINGKTVKQDGFITLLSNK